MGEPLCAWAFALTMRTEQVKQLENKDRDSQVLARKDRGIISAIQKQKNKDLNLMVQKVKQATNMYREVLDDACDGN